MKKHMISAAIGLLAIACTQAPEPCPPQQESPAVGFNNLVEDFPGAEMGSQSDVDIWLKYLEYLNAKDLEGLATLQADSIEVHTANGKYIKGAEAHRAALSEWIYDTDATWKPVWGTAIRQAGGDTTGSFVMAVSDMTVRDGEETRRVNNMFTVWIKDSKVQAFWFFKRDFTQKELDMIEAAEAAEAQE